jgi:hypothetical protein
VLGTLDGGAIDIALLGEGTGVLVIWGGKLAGIVVFGLLALYFGVSFDKILPKPREKRVFSLLVLLLFNSDNIIITVAAFNIGNIVGISASKEALNPGATRIIGLLALIIIPRSLLVFAPVIFMPVRDVFN